MGESIADLQTFPDKMIGETTTASDPALEVSVSFGRFENDSLSWEKWSAFSPNKYLEEVEKCATPGSVAQKKAYFEAHYKKIAARKAELLEQERQAQNESNEGDLTSNGCLMNRREIVVSEDQSSAEEVERDEIGSDSNREGLKVDDVASDVCKSSVVEREANIDTSVVSEESKSLVSEREEKKIDTSVVSDEECKSLVAERETKIDTSVVIEKCQSSEVEREKVINNTRVVSDEHSNLVVEREKVIDNTRVVSVEYPNSVVEREKEINNTRVISDESPNLVAEREEEIDSTLLSEKLSKSEDVAANEVEIVSFGSKPEKEEEALALRDSKTEEETVKLDNNEEPQKVMTSAIKERVVARSKKTPISPKPITRTPKSSIPRVTNLRPTSASSRVSISSVSESSTKKSNNTPSFSRNKTPSSSGEAKKKAAPKSLHMTSLDLGRAKSNSPSLITTNRQSLIMEKMGDKDIVKRAFKAFQNNFNQVRSFGDESPLQKQVSSTRTEPKVSTSTTPRKENGGLLKTDRLDKRSVRTPTPSSFGLKSVEREVKRTEFTKKPELKSNATDTEKTRLQTRSKEAKESETKKLRESLNFKATPMPAFYRGQKISKSALDNKTPTKTVTRR